MLFAASRPVKAADEQLPTKLTLHPAAEPKPALKYRLLPPFTEQIPGNAAVDYGKVMAENTQFFDFQNRALWDKIEDVWQEMPLEQLKHEDIQFPISAQYFLQQGARRKYCDWQFPIGEVPFYTMMLPEAQQSRSYARVLAVTARREIAEGKFDDAINTFGTNYALARNVAEGETLVNGLIGIAICGLTFDQVLAYVQQPGAPNLYWALTMLPTPLIDSRKAIEVEMQGVELTFPELRSLETAKRTPEEWRELFHRFAKEAVVWTSMGLPKPQPPSSEELDKACEELLPTAKQFLLDRGIARETVEAMSVYQVTLLYTLRLNHELFDEAAKYYFLPYPQAIEGIDTATSRAERAKQVIPLTSQILRSIRPTRGAIARNDRQFAVLRVLEAVRLYGASHEGRLPEALEDITEVPVPVDPVTGQPFAYLRAGDYAILSGPTLRDRPLHYEIKMVPTK